ncbi:acyl-CoA/acyl-ACP dehydrogenase [Plantibacter sp. VKM Ac-2885]|uniref:acyl-CoA dehydrogenase family protein n=1 Tax=Plantibacter sp. VKM Ac-2885 TaxID=2783828 RepID=UPI00188C1001|nr:acyl-CoA/acyl-ACP dehydrogenase [Plantibacter sp. VKM Ac-2885]
MTAQAQHHSSDRSFDPASILSDGLVERIRERAAVADRENAFFDEDLAELRACGYLRAFVPEEFGGLGLGLGEVTLLQSRLATAAPATALAINMHLVWTGVARLLHTRGDDSLRFVLEGAAGDELYAFGVSEAGNDLVLFGSDTEARPGPDGSYRFHGRKIFTSLSPAWTWLGTTGVDTTSADGPKVVYGFIDRSRGGFEILDDWDTVGMRASQSRTTLLQGAESTAEHIVRRLDPGPNPDPIVFGIFACFETLIAAVYTGIGERALRLAVETAHRKTSKKAGGASYAADPDIRRRIASAAIAYDGMLPQLAGIARDLDDGIDHGALWFPKLVGLKVRATETAREVVDQAIRVAGGGSYFAASELGRLYRDVLAGMFHPSDDESAHATVANAWLGPV